MIKKLIARIKDPLNRSDIPVEPIYPVSSERMKDLMQQIAETTGTDIKKMKFHY